MRRIIFLSLLTALSSCADHGTNTAEKPAATNEALKAEVAPPASQPSSPPLIAGKYVVKSTLRGKMSWYSVKTNGGTVTASGERFSNSGATAAHKTLKFGTRVRVTNLRNNKSEIVRITDRGPYIKGRIIDVSIGTARKLDFVNAGVVPCKVEVLGTP